MVGEAPGVIGADEGINPVVGAAPASADSQARLTGMPSLVVQYMGWGR